MVRVFIIFVVALQSLCIASATEIEQREELIPFGDMESWFTRKIDESGIIGGERKFLYELAPEGEVEGRVAYDNLKGESPWATSNVYAHVAGIHKTNSSVFPDARDGGKSALLMTRIEKVKVLGIVNISVIAAGSIYLGSMIEPIRGTANPQAMLNSGIPFTKRPTAVRFDYKVELSGEPNRLYMNGFSGKKEVDGLDKPIMILLLQKRWEDADGKIHASRIGTMVVNYTQSSDWKENATYSIIYGDATHSSEFTPEMALGFEQRYGLNSRGENVPIIEESWASEDETPTHVILHFASSHGGAYVGSPGNKMWIDNVRFVY